MTVRCIKKIDRLEKEKGSCASQGEKAAIVKELKEQGYKLKFLLHVIGLSKLTYDFEISKDDQIAIRNEESTKEIETLFDKYKGRYGVRRIYRALKAKGINVNYKRVQSIMHINGLPGKRPKEKYHSYKGHIGKVADNNNIINRDFKATVPLL